MNKNKCEKTKVPISSLIDVVFLLIMFFVVTAVIDSEPDIPVELTKASNMKPGSIPPARVELSIQRDGSIFVDNMYVYQPERLTGILVNLKEERGTATVTIIRADKETSHEVVDKVIESIKKSGLSKIRINAELLEK